ncbi:hypothetical protein [uncultured Dokdonia sp.]|uniref:hypothetical protein n=1 Tax=uncultured Dokdonia sp. TaxID=575653 RepID=UPI002633D337|nr:hypothetical protein [uncultured Dokdonia sp.]
MKSILTTLFLVCISTSALSQEYRAQFGSFTNCARQGRHLCSIENISQKDVNRANASFITTEEGAIILRIHRDKLTKEEQDRILGAPITSRNKNDLQFTMEKALSLPEGITALTSKTRSKQLTILEAKSYPTIISDQYIDITIVIPNNIESKN